MPEVLLIEDDASIRRMLAFSLREAGMKVIEVTNGSDALALLLSRPPRAVVLDLGLPDNMGGEVLKWLQAGVDGEHGSVVWIAISAMDRADATGRYGLMDDRLLAKPFNPWQLVDMLEKLLSSDDATRRNKDA